MYNTAIVTSARARFPIYRFITVRILRPLAKNKINSAQLGIQRYIPIKFQLNPFSGFGVIVFKIRAAFCCLGGVVQEKIT